MRSSLLAGVLLLGAASTGTPAAYNSSAPRDQDDQALIASQTPHWLRFYPLSPYKEHWTLTVTVREMKKDLPRILEILSQSGGTLTQPLENFAASPSAGIQQLSARLSMKGAGQALKAIKKTGAAGEPLVRPAAERVPMAEVKEKIRKLMAEKAAHAKELAALPTASAVIDEMLEHLLMVESVHEKAGTEVLLNMTVQEKR